MQNDNNNSNYSLLEEEIELLRKQKEAISTLPDNSEHSLQMIEERLEQNSLTIHFVREKR